MPDAVPGVARVSLPGGRELVVRVAEPADVDGLRALYEGLSPEDNHRRFFSMYHPQAAFLERKAGVEKGRVQLVALVSDGGGGERLVAEAGYVLLPDGDGELAITVAADWRGWLGAYLLDALIAEASAHGVTNLQADVLLENRPMLALLHRRGYVVAGHGDYAVVRVVIPTAGGMPSWPPHGEGLRVLVEVAGGRWRAEDAAYHAGLLLRMCPGPLHRGGSGCPAIDGEECPLAAGADVIVCALRPDNRAADVLAAHDRLHPHVPLCADLPHDTGDHLRIPGRVVRLDPDSPDGDVVARVREQAGQAAARAK